MTRRLGYRISVLFAVVALANCGGPSQPSSNQQAPGLSVAEDALRSGSPAMALQVTHSILAKLPDDVGTLLIQGQAAAQLGNTADAEDAFTHVLRIKSDSVRAQIGLGRLRLPMDPNAAAILFQNVVKQAPRNLSASNNLGIARDLLGQHREAQEAYRMALAIDPTNVATRTNMALSLAMTGNGTEAVELIAPLASSPSATPRIRHDYAVVLAMAGREAEARQVLGHDLTPDQVKQVLDAARQQRAGGF